MQIKWIILLFGLICFPSQEASSQTSYSSKDNYTGAWETPATWNPAWTAPQTAIDGSYIPVITINGYITVNNSLSFAGSASNLVVNDTLVIKGDLSLGNNNDLTVNNKGIIIVWGNLTFNNQTLIIANNYLIITGNVLKSGTIYQGSWTSNDNPVKVFIGGTLHSGLSYNVPNYSAVNCVSPATTPYPNTSCSYGNMTDIMSDPIYAFLQNSCSSTNISTNSSVCASDVITLPSSNGTAYSWSGPDGFTSSERNPLIPDANPAMAGAYIITLTVSSGCTDKDTINVTVNPLPVVKITSSSSPMRNYDSRTLTGTPAGGTFSISEGPGTITGNVLSATGPGIIKIEYNYTDVCANKDSASIAVNPFIPSVITPNGDGKNDYFQTGENTGQIELIIFNRWGIEEYNNDNYLNDWDGRNNNGAELPDDTYFYIVKFEHGNIIRGSVLIKR